MLVRGLHLQCIVVALALLTSAAAADLREARAEYSSESTGSSLPFVFLGKDLKKAQDEYKNGRVAEADKVLRELEPNTSHHNYPLTLLSIGSVSLSLGDFRYAGRCFRTVLAGLEAELGIVGIADQVLSSDSKRMYRGFPHERVMAHTYLGLAYLQQSRLDDARVEFAKAAEEDKGKKAEQVDDYAPTHFLDGMRALKAKDYQYARVSFRIVIELCPDFGLGWYGLARASLLDRDETEADHAWSRYEALTDSTARLAKDGSTPCTIFVVDAGWGPERTEDALFEDIGAWKKPDYPERKIAVTVAGNNQVYASKIGDTYFQASTTGGLVKELKKKVVSSIFKKALGGLIPSLGSSLKSEPDLRAWTLAPGETQVAAVKVPQEPTSVEVNAYTEKEKRIKSDRQVLYYITGRPFEDAQLVYVRILPHVDDDELAKQQMMQMFNRSFGNENPK